MKLSVNVSTVYRGVPAPQAIRQAAIDGFQAIEIQVPYDTPVAALRLALEETGLPLILINLPFKQAEGAEWPAIAPEAEDQFRAGVELACTYAQALHVPMVNALAGVPGAGQDRQAAFDRYCERLAWAAPALADAGAQSLVEAVNTTDVPGFLFTRVGEAMAAIEATGGGQRLQFDVYHSHQMEDDAVATFDRLVDRVGHVQFADWPGRGEPGTGEIDFAAWFARLSRDDYRGLTGQGWAGAEYNRDPDRPGQQDWLSAYLG